MKDQQQNGQSLVEFLIVTPIFFIILSGLISFFYLQNKRYLDFEANISLRLSEVLFPEEERQLNHWQEEARTPEEIIFSSLNPSRAYRPRKNEVFEDKLLVTSVNEKTCSTNNTFSVKSNDQGRFLMSTCSNKNGYEKYGFSFQKVLKNFSIFPTEEQGESIFFPYDELQWNKRPELISHPVGNFSPSPEGRSFSKNIASLMIPKDSSLLNGQCLLEPFNPQCDISSYSGKMNRAAGDGANAQLTACYLEMLIGCGKAGPLFPECVAEGVVEITLSAKLGRSARNCPLVNKEVEAMDNFIRKFGRLDSWKNKVNEASMRKNIF